MDQPKLYKAARLMRGMSQWDCAQATCGVIRQFEISNFERGRTKLSDTKLTALAQAIGVPADSLVSPRDFMTYLESS